MTGKQITKNQAQSGFTLMEIIIVIAVFSITVVMSIDLFLSYTKLQKRASVEQELGSDARFIYESIVRQFRLGTIDYDFYGDPDPVLANDAITIGATPVKYVTGPMLNQSILAVVDQGGGSFLYRHEAIAGRGYVKLSTDGGINWSTITPDTVNVVRMDFYLAPSSNPFELNPDLDETSPKYLSNEQPRLTLVMETQSLNEKPPVITHFQTTVSSRLYVR